MSSAPIDQSEVLLSCVILEKSTIFIFLCSLLLFPPRNNSSSRQKAPGTAADCAHGKATQASPNSGVRQRSGGAANGNNVQDPPGCDDVTYSWENTCLFQVSETRQIAVHSHHPWPLMCSASFCCAMVTRCVLRTSNYPLLVCSEIAFHNQVHAGDSRRLSRPTLLFACRAHTSWIGSI